MPEINAVIRAPLYDEGKVGGREIFAKWVPEFDKLANSFTTDANGFDLVTHDILVEGAFSAAFVPVDVLITA